MDKLRWAWPLGVLAALLCFSPMHAARAEWIHENMSSVAFPGTDQNPWFSLGGNLTAQPSCVSLGGDRVDCFARQNDVFRMMWQTSKVSGWSPWDPLGGTLDSAPKCVSWGPDRIDCFGRYANGTIWTRAGTASAWLTTDWVFLGFTAGATEPPSVVSWGPGRIDLFVTTGTGALWHKWYDNGQWLPTIDRWETLGGGGFGGTALKAAPACVSSASGRLDCFALLSDGTIGTKWWDGGPEWKPSRTGWKSLGGGTADPPVPLAWDSNRVSVFIKAADATMWHKWWDGTRWQPSDTGWESLGGGLTSVPGCASWGAGRIDCFVRGTDGAVWHKWRDAAGWGPSTLAWEARYGQALDAPVVVAPAAGRLDVFVRGTDNALWHSLWRERESLAQCARSNVVVGSVGGTGQGVQPMHSAYYLEKVNRAHDPAAMTFTMPFSSVGDIPAINAIDVAVAIGGGIMPGTSTIVLRNGTTWTKHVTGCGANVSQTISVPGGTSATMRIDRTQITTVKLAKDVCTFAFIGCWSIDREDVAVFTERDFWALADGRTLTFSWTSD